MPNIPDRLCNQSATDVNLYAGSTNDAHGTHSQIYSHLLRCLVAVKRQCTPSALHNNARTKPTQHTCLVVLCRVKLRDNHIIRVGKVRLACWADARSAGGIRETEVVAARNAKDVTREKLAKEDRPEDGGSTEERKLTCRLLLPRGRRAESDI